jgi:hypothetical protein
VDRQADELFRSANTVIIVLGIIETWMQPKTGNFYRQIPHPDAFDSVGAVFHRLSVAEMMDDLAHIRALLRQNADPDIILTVSPTPLQATATPFDVRVANCECQARMRAAASEFTEHFPDIHYFHANEIVTTAESMSDFMKEDGRHIHREGIDYILHQFLSIFGCEDVPRRHVDTSWMTVPTKVALRPKKPWLTRVSQRIASISRVQFARSQRN